MSNDSPVDYTEDTVEVTTVPFAAVSTVAHYATTSTDEGGEADGSGTRASATTSAALTVGYPVSVSVTATAGRAVRDLLNVVHLLRQLGAGEKRH